MRCPDCGAESASDYKFCPRCGHAFDPYAQRPFQTYGPNRSESSHTGLIIVAVVIVVAAVIIAPIVLYVLVLGFGTDGLTTPQAVYSKSHVVGGIKINIVSITRNDVPWDDVKLQVSDGTSFAEWDLRAAGLDDGSISSVDYDPEFLGGLRLNLTVTDLGGNGFVSGMDYFTVTSNPQFSSATTYSVYLVYEPTGELMGTGIYFTG